MELGLLSISVRSSMRSSKPQGPKGPVGVITVTGYKGTDSKASP